MSMLRQTRYTALRDEVFESLQEAVIEGRLSAGTRLVEAEVASQLGVSKTPVREAIIRLERAGLVETHPRRGTFVAQIGASTFYEILVVRTLVEGHVSAEAAARLTDDDVAHLSSLVEQMATSMDLSAWASTSDLDIAFHERLYRLAGNRLLLDFWHSFRDQIRFYHRVSREYSGWITHPSNRDNHRELLNELRTQDPARARQAAEEHIRRGSVQLGLEFAAGPPSAISAAKP